MQKKVWCIVLIAVLLTGFGTLAFAGGGKDTQTQGQQTLRLWDVVVRDPHPKARDMMIAEFQRRNPNVKVETTTLTGDINQKILTAASAKTLPDIVFVWGAGDVVTWGQMNITT
ncbi:MAG: extracellular solute-binding protein, partial [Treponema sp.]|nr:extracellular solute-binding protein [Treponema sp.]